MNVIVGDGLDVIMQKDGYDVVMLDVDAKDLSQPLLFPPKAFLEKGFLNHISQNVLNPGGALILNLVCYNATRSFILLFGVSQGVVLKFLGMSHGGDEQGNASEHCRRV